ncbi:hypothetical protein B0H19DRAFT_1059953 [Mycena capillaripes]|nr:hypothetical protein B0H19DRAFT_1083946 [Mycena capillaripes]KAJ6585765.1 hypothetical protein B0H19DRAFT_1059953 [Mycena capillaripes]
MSSSELSEQDLHTVSESWWHPRMKFTIGLFAVPVTGTAVVSAGVQRANPSRVRTVMSSRKISMGQDRRRNGRHGQRDGDGAFAEDKLRHLDWKIYGSFKLS